MITNKTIGGKEITTKYEPWFRGNLRIYDWVNHGADLIEVDKDGKLIEHNERDWRAKQLGAVEVDNG